MNFSSRKRILAFAAACLMLMSNCTAIAEQAVVSKSAIVYASAKTSSKKLGKLNAGTELEIIAEKNGWSKVELNGRVGFMKSSTLKSEAEAQEERSYTAYANVDGAKVYNSKGKATGKVGINTKVTVTAEKNGVCQVKRGGVTAYMKKSQLSTKPVEVKEEEKFESYTAYANVEDAKVYNSKGKVTGKVGINTKVTVTAEKNGVCQVKRGDVTAYMKKSQLSTKPVEVEEEEKFESYTAYANVEDAKVYNAKGKVTGKVGINTEVTVTAEKNGVCQVKRGKTIAYMMKNQLSTSKVKEDNGVTEIDPTTFYVKPEEAKVYNAKGKVTGKLAQNAKVTVTAYTDELAKISYNGATGYMYRSDLSSKKIETGITKIDPTTFYVKNDNAKVLDDKGDAIGKLAVNTKVTVTAYTDKYAQVTNGSTIGYMLKSDLSDKKVETKDDGVTEISPTTYYVKNENAAMVDSNGKTIAKLAINTAVTVTAYNDKYAKVTHDSKAGFILRSDLSEKKSETTLVLEYGDKGEAVSKVQARLKELGYFTGNVGGNYLDLTKAAVTAFQAAAGLTTTGVCDEKTLTAMFASDAPKKETPKEDEKEPDSGTGGSTATPARGTAKEMDWWTSGIQSIFSRGTVATVTDVKTGLAWKEKRTGGTNHADVQPVTAADTAALKKAYGGTWSWNRRAVFVTINGVNYAASINGMPHGSDSIADNNFNGHHCIHFTNSRTHGSNKVCSLHQAAIAKAAKASL